MKNIVIWIIGLVVVIGLVVYLFTRNNEPSETPTPTPQTATTTPTTPTASSTTQTEPEDATQTMIGSSVEDRDITAYHYGTGDQELLFVGGIHGGYSWNTAVIAYELMDYLDENPEKIPEGYRVTVIPVLNPDGLFKTTGSEGRFTPPTTPLSLAATIPGRFNANTVDLNRNFDCEWQAEGTWQTRTVSGGTAPFSEPESQAVRDYVTSHNIAGAVVWYSAAGGVFASTCNNGISNDTQALTDAYAKASGYRPYQDFDFYEITGDMVNWFAKQNIPAISVLLSTHTDTDWSKNQAGIDAFLNYFAE